jgi:Family of unknown function (DUF5683)
MGSGGPRGLQILRSGVNRVRGGFDSHAFPPCLAPAPARFAAVVLGAMLAFACAAPAFAQFAQNVPGPDSSIVDTAKIVEFPRAGTNARTYPTATPTGFDEPRWVMMRSLVVPGWGQLHNGSWTKALGVAASEVFLGIRIYQDHQELDRLSAAADQETDPEIHNDLVHQYNDQLNRSIRNGWLLGGVIVYSLLDAYIDAHFAHFDVEFEPDPALPADTGTPGQRVKLRWHW